MSNFSQDDRHRSLRDFVALALGSPPWRVRTQRGAVADEDRPVALVEVTTPIGRGELPGRVSIPQGNVTRQQTFTLSLWPSFVDEDGGALTANDARLVAAQVAEQLEQSIGVGLVDDAGVSLTPPERIPVFDYAGVPASGADRVLADGAEPYGWLWVEDFPVRTLQDPDDTLRWTVVCDLRTSWEQAGRVRADTQAAPIVARMGGVFVPPGGDPDVMPPLPPPSVGFVLVGDGPPDSSTPPGWYLDRLTGELYEVT